MIFKSSLLFLFVAGCILIPRNSSPQRNKTLTFSFNNFRQKDTLKFAECTLRNNTDTVFWIIAYGTTSSHGKKYIHAIYSLQENKNGTWKDGGLGFSGIGIDRYRLSPGEEFEFETPDFDATADAIKLGIEMRIKSREDQLRTIRTIWTDEIKLR